MATLPTYERHPLSAAWPDPTTEEFRDIVQDMRTNGYDLASGPVYIYEGLVLDGWTRYTAANAAGVAVPFADYTGSDPKGFVVRRNANRRNMTPGQRAACIVACQDMVDVGRPGDSEYAVTRQEVAKEAGVSEQTVKNVRTGERGGFGEQMRSGEMSPYAAATATRDRERQDRGPVRTFMPDADYIPDDEPARDYDADFAIVDGTGDAEEFAEQMRESDMPVTGMTASPFEEATRVQGQDEIERVNGALDAIDAAGFGGTPPAETPDAEPPRERPRSTPSTQAQAQMDLLQSEIRSLTQDKIALQAKVDLLEADGREIEGQPAKVWNSLTTEMKAQAEEVDRLRKENTDLQRQLNRCRQLGTKLEAENKRLQALELRQ